MNNSLVQLETARAPTLMILRLLIGAGAGAALGFGWHKRVGCSTGACALTRNPVISTL